MKKTLQPLLDRLIIIEEKEPGKTETGLLIPEGVKKDYAIGRIISKGGYVKEAEVDAQCAFDHNQSTRIVVDWQEYVIVKEMNVFAIYK